MKKPTKKDGHKHGSYLIMTHRTAPTTNPNCQRIYAKNADAYERATEPSAHELESRARLAAAARATQTRIANLSTIEADEAAWRAQKDQPGGKKTFYAAFSPMALWLCSFLMLLGRLECMTVLVLFLPRFWRR